MNESNSDMNRRLRAAAGREDPRAVAARAIAAAEAAGDVATLKARVAARTGLPAGLAGRLKGETAADLLADAEALAKALGDNTPTPSFNDIIRGLAGRSPAPSATEGEPEPVPSFDGGVRETGPPPPPSMNAQIRAARDYKQERIAEGARNYDRLP